MKEFLQYFLMKNQVREGRWEGINRATIYQKYADDLKLGSKNSNATRAAYRNMAGINKS